MEKRINREYKSTLFVLVFGNRKENLLDLVNAVNGTAYKDPEEIEYTTPTATGLFRPPEERPSFLIDKTMASTSTSPVPPQLTSQCGCCTTIPISSGNCSTEKRSTAGSRCRSRFHSSLFSTTGRMSWMRRPFCTFGSV